MLFLYFQVQDMTTQTVLQFGLVMRLLIQLAENTILEVFHFRKCHPNTKLSLHSFLRINILRFVFDFLLQTLEPVLLINRTILRNFIKH